MNTNRFRTNIPRLAASAAFLMILNSAYADVYGRLHIIVKNADDEKPISGVRITLEDSAKVLPRLSLTTRADGSVTTDPLEVRAWHISTNAQDFQDDIRDVTPIRDTTVDVEILMEPVKEKVITIKGRRSPVKTGDTSNSTTRNQNFFQNFPTSSNPQSLQKALVTAPGMVLDSNGQVHPGGEHSATTIYINGFQLPGAFQGRFGQVLSATAAQSIDVQTGGYAPEYGSEAAAILNVDLRAGTVTPFTEYTLQKGSFDSLFGDLAFGGQFGHEYGEPLDGGLRARQFSYFGDITAHGTNNAIEPPQPQIQTDHNYGQSYTGFTNFDFHASDRDTLSLFAGDNPASNEIVDRTGLPDNFAAYGQGYGLNGWRNADGSIPTGLIANPGGLGSQTLKLASQYVDGQADNQQDHNEFGVLNWRHKITDTMNSLLSLGLTHSGIDTTNRNPDIGSLVWQGNGGGLPTDNSIEYNPTIHRNSHDAEANGSLTAVEKNHTLKLGFVFDQQDGEESYQLTPGSQLAMDLLANAALGQPGLLPAGSYDIVGGAQQYDVYGNPIYYANAGAAAPVLDVARSGHYAASYVQDTWKVTHKFTVNYGLRYDDYAQTQTTLTNGANPTVEHVNQQFVSPRVNAAYAFDSKTVLRGSFNRLVTQPPLAEGQILGTQIVPETWSQFDTSIERQVGPGQSVRVGIYDKFITNQIDTSLLIGQTQMGAYTSVNFQNGHTQGLEISYNLLPGTLRGLAAYLSYTNSLAKPTGAVDGNAALFGTAPTYNDHDQLNTLSTGASYQLQRSKTILAGDLYFGSGVESSRLAPDLPRNYRYYLNLSITQPNVFHNVDLEFLVENVTDNRAVINFQSGFSGTRFQQGRTALLALKGKF